MKFDVASGGDAVGEHTAVEVGLHASNRDDQLGFLNILFNLRIGDRADVDLKAKMSDPMPQA